MTFETPTTKEKMYEVLQQIYQYYRIQREGFVGTELEELELERLEVLPLSDSELSVKARTLLSGKHEREISEYERNIDEKIAGLNSKLADFQAEKESATREIYDLYDESERKVEEQAIKNGLVGSSIIIDKLTKLETEKNNKIAEINSLYAQKIADCNSQIAELQAKISQSQNYFSEIHEQEISAKVIELKDEQAKTQVDVFKYNNTLDEKETKYRNALNKSNLELKFKFMEIQSGGMTKEELVEVGYYDDVLDCVFAYYNTLPALQAYQDIVQEQRLIIFLEHYYQDTVYVYKLRASD